MDRTRLLEDVDEGSSRTYAEPLAGLRVSWGSILAGALAILAVSTILWALAAAIVLTATHATMSSVIGTVVALWICAMATTLVGAFVGGLLGGYLPGNRRTSIGAMHGFLAWALAFLVSSAAGFAMIGGVARTTTSAATTAASATMQTAGSAVGGIAGGQMTLDTKAENLLESLGYSRSEATSMVQQGKASIQQELRGGGAQPAMPNARGAIDTLIEWMAGLTWAWFGTWFVSAIVAVIGGVLGVRRLRRHVVERPVDVGSTDVQVVPQPA